MIYFRFVSFRLSIIFLYNIDSFQCCLWNSNSNKINFKIKIWKIKQQWHSSFESICCDVEAIIITKPQFFMENKFAFTNIFDGIVGNRWMVVKLLLASLSVQHCSIWTNFVDIARPAANNRKMIWIFLFIKFGCKLSWHTVNCCLLKLYRIWKHSDEFSWSKSAEHTFAHTIYVESENHFDWGIKGKRCKSYQSYNRRASMVKIFFFFLERRDA